MANNVTYRKSRTSPNATLACYSLAGRFLPVEWAKDGLAIPRGSGLLNNRYRYELVDGNLTIIDAHKLNAGDHTFECRINSHALQAATQTTYHTMRTMSVPVKLKILPKASSKWDNNVNEGLDADGFRTAVVHVPELMQSDAQAQTTSLDGGSDQNNGGPIESVDDKHLHRHAISGHKKDSVDFDDEMLADANPPAFVKKLETEAQRDSSASVLSSLGSHSKYQSVNLWFSMLLTLLTFKVLL